MMQACARDTAAPLCWRSSFTYSEVTRVTQSTTTAQHHEMPALARSKRRPALDGIRALSVVAVMIYHANPAWLPGGYLAVNVFFVLSGYLITGLLLKEASRWGTIDLVSFYKNRARRLLPALFVVVAVVTAVGAHILTSNARAHLRGDALATLLYVANWRFILEGESYFASTGDPSPFRHMWTLAIEEQFYFVFPILLLGLMTLARGRRRRIAWGLVALAAVSALVQAWIYLTQIKTMPTPDPSRIYYGTDTRANELLLGAATAVAMTYWRKRTLRAHAARLTVIGMAAFAAIFAYFALAHEDSAWIFLGGMVFFSLLVCFVIVAVEVWPSSLLADALSWKPIVWIGELSYGIYLWHWPLFVFLNEQRTGWNEWVLLAVRLALTLVLATISYYVIEQPIRTKRVHAKLGNTKSVVAWSVALPATLAVALFSTMGIKPVTDARAGSEFDTTVGSGDKKIAVVGDSVGYVLASGFPASTYPDVSVTGSVKVGCGTAEQWLVVNGVRQSQDNPECRDVFSPWQNAVRSSHAKVVVWSMGAWDVFDHYVDGEVIKETSPQYATYFRARLEKGLASFGTDTQVFIPKAACYAQPKYEVEGQDLAPNRNDPKRAQALNAIIDDFAKAHPDRVHAVDPSTWLCKNGKPVEKIDGEQVREDGVHYTAAGSKKFWAWLMPHIRPYLGPTKPSPTATK